MLVDFWTYSCINCLRAIPYVRAWAEKYKDQGLVVIGVHAPEFAFEKNIDNVEGGRRPISGSAIRSRSTTTTRSGAPSTTSTGRRTTSSMPRAASATTISAKATTTRSERVIQQLLAEAGHANAAGGTRRGQRRPARRRPRTCADVHSPETYVGYERGENFVSPGGVGAGHGATSTRPATPRLNEWGLSGDWTIGGEHAALNAGDGSIVYRFHARDLHLVLGPAPDGKPVRFRVTIDGAAPGESHGMDVDADGKGIVTEQRLYQLIRQTGADRATARSRSSSSIPACRPTPSPSAEIGADR